MDSLMVRIVMSKAVFIGWGCRNSLEEGFLILGVFKGKTRVGCKDMKTKCPECQETEDMRPVFFWEGNFSRTGSFYPRVARSWHDAL